MKRITFFLITVLFLGCLGLWTNISADPDIRTMAGWHECFANNKKYLSPFQGFVFSKIAEKYYQAGNIDATWDKPAGHNISVVKSFENGDANIKLLYHLFHALGDQFNIVAEPSWPAYYFTPEVIGRIIACMDKAVETGNEAYIMSDELTKMHQSGKVLE